MKNMVNCEIVVNLFIHYNVHYHVTNIEIGKWGKNSSKWTENYIEGYLTPHLPHYRPYSIISVYCGKNWQRLWELFWIWIHCTLTYQYFLEVLLQMELDYRWWNSHPYLASPFSVTMTPLHWSSSTISWLHHTKWFSLDVSEFYWNFQSDSGLSAIVHGFLD